jgi:hypothetical protein
VRKLKERKSTPKMRTGKSKGKEKRDRKRRVEIRTENWERRREERG